MRQPKALQAKAKTHQVIPLDHDIFRVTSGNSGNSYLVRFLPDVQGALCDCKWGEYRKYADFHRSGCSHVQAAYKYLENMGNRETSTWASEEDARRQHRPTINIGDGIWMTTRRI